FGPEYAEHLTSAAMGEIIGPIEIEGPGKPTFVVLEVVGVQSEGAWEFEDVRDEVWANVRVQKQLDRYLSDLRDETYIEIRL
ncbi:MAG: peptidylprolyl isomerase, partial [Gemmatimonadota bacterium]